VAGLLLTTEVMVAESPKDDDKHGGMPDMGDMGGMGGMGGMGM
jgi:chaperonin GroEL